MPFASRRVLISAAILATLGAFAQTLQVLPTSSPRTVPDAFSGMNWDWYAQHPAGVPFGTPAAGPLQIRMWRIPTGAFGNEWHFLSGEYNQCNWVDAGMFKYCDPPDAGAVANGPTFDTWVRTIQSIGGQLLVVLPYEASDQEILNFIEYANGASPPSPNPSWTTSSYAENEAAPAGYFAWLRGQRLRIAPVGVRYWEIGNELYIQNQKLPDYQSFHDGGLYGARAAKLMNEIRAIDPASRLGVVGAREKAYPAWDALVWTALADAGVAPDFYIEHKYAFYPATQEGADAATVIMATPDSLLTDAVAIRALASGAFPGLGSSLELFNTEFGPTGGLPAHPWFAQNIWSAIEVVTDYARALEAGYANADFFELAADPNSPCGGFGAVCDGGDGSFLYNSTYFGAYLWGRFAQGGEQILSVDGGSQNLLVYAVAPTDGGLRVLIINRDLSAAAPLSVLLPPGTGANGMHRFTYDSALGGAASSDDASVPHSWAERPAEDDLPVVDGLVQLTQEPLSIVVLETEALVIADGGNASDAGADGGAGGSIPSPTSGCACSGSSAAPWVFIAVFFLAVLRRRSSRTIA